MNKIMPIIVLLLCFFAFPVHAEPILNIQKVTSENGITAWLVEDKSVPVIAMDFAFKGQGSVNDPPEKQGLTYMLASMLTEGAGELDAQEFQKQLQNQSISLSFSGSRDDFFGSLKTLTKNKEKAFELLRLALSEPRFDDEPFERQKQTATARIRSSLANPSWVAARIMNDVAYEGHAYAQNSGGTITTLTALKQDDLRGHMQNFALDQLHVSVAGDMSADELKTTLDNTFSFLPKTTETQRFESLSLQNTQNLHIFKKEIPQSIIQIQQRGIDRNDPDYQTAQILNFILGGSGFGSRLMDKIREQKGLTYGIYSNMRDMDFIDTLSIRTSTGNENAEDMLSLIEEIKTDLANNGITNEELKNAQTYLIDSLPLSFSSTDAISGILLSLQLDNLPITYLEERNAALRAVTKENVQNLAKSLLLDEPSVTVIVGKPMLNDKRTINRITEVPNAE